MPRRQCCQRSASRKTTLVFPSHLPLRHLDSANCWMVTVTALFCHKSAAAALQAAPSDSRSKGGNFFLWHLVPLHVSHPPNPDFDTVTIRTTPVVLSLSSTSPPPPVIGHCFPFSRSKSGNEIYRFQISGGGRVKAGEGWRDPL